MAESYSGEVAIHPELTPTLYRLSREGFQFENFYTPLWGVSTSDGEYVTTTGLLPKSGVWSYLRSAENAMPFGFGRLFSQRGYRALAFHDHTYTYYGRDQSHPNMGYEFYGVGVSTASHPLGPWVKYADNPLMTTDLSKGISSPGHNSLVEAPDGSLYIVYHRHADPHCQKPNWDRVVCMDRLYFDENGKLCTDGPTNTAQKVEW